jgi:hypothetical protein
MRANSERLAPPQVVLADYFPRPAHNQWMNHDQICGSGKQCKKIYPIFAFFADIQIL